MNKYDKYSPKKLQVAKLKAGSSTKQTRIIIIHYRISSTHEISKYLPLIPLIQRFLYITLEHAKGLTTGMRHAPGILPPKLRPNPPVAVPPSIAALLLCISGWRTIHDSLHLLHSRFVILLGFENCIKIMSTSQQWYVQSKPVEKHRLSRLFKS